MKKLLILLIILYAVLYIAPLGVRPMFTPDETRYAEIPREMIASGNWVSPRLNGLRYFEKPVMGYWLNGLAMLVFGRNPFAIRFPSAIAAGLSALLAFILARKYTKSEKVALLAAVIFLTFQEVYFIGTFSVLDTLLTAFLTGALAFYFLALDEPKKFLKFVYLAVFGACCGGAFLVKGFLAFAVPVIVIVPFMFWQKRWKELFYLPWLPIVFAVLVSLPWALAIHFQEPDYWRYFFWEEHVKRFLSADGPKHPQPFFFFIPVILAGAIPWTFLAPAAFIGLKKKGFRATPFIKYLLCWLIVPFVFFSISRGKLATYILPCFPALAALFAIGLTGYFKNNWRKSFNIGAGILAGIMGGVFVGLFVASFFAVPYGSGENLKLALGMGGILAWALFSFASFKAQEANRKIALFCLGPLLVMFIAHFIIPDMLLATKAPEDFFKRNAHKVTEDSILVAYPSLTGAASWYLKRNDIYVLHKGGELEYGLNCDDAKGRLLSFKDFEKFVRKNKNVILIMEHRDKREAYVPEGKAEDVEGEMFFIEF